jgi:hypothetical protein
LLPGGDRTVTDGPFAETREVMGGYYAFCPETMREIGAALGLRVRTGLYRYPTPEPGKSWDDVAR